MIFLISQLVKPQKTSKTGGAYWQYPIHPNTVILAIAMEIHMCCVSIYLIWWIFYGYFRLEEIHKLMVPAKWESTFKKMEKQDRTK